MKKIKWIILIQILFLGLFHTSSQASMNFIRISGSSRYETSVKVSESLYQETVDNVVLVSGENYPDGLTGGVLASVLDGPVLLTGKNSLPLTVENRLRILKPQNIYILGGNGSITKTVESKVNRYGKVIRIAGRNRYETAEKVANLIYQLPQGNKKYIGIANGNNFPDALSAGGYLSNAKIPLLLTSKNQLSPGIPRLLAQYNILRSIIIGGEGQVPSAIIPQQLSKAYLRGNDRYTTSVKVAEEGFLNTKRVIITSGEVYPDALAAAPLSNYMDAPILLSGKNQLPQSVIDYIKQNKIEKIVIVGGKSSLPDEIFEELGIKANQLPSDPEKEPVG
ncbi:MAG: cell wall-binding repeat-containing protein [Tissierellia bacterium]|nr:cell wall-binding repeat-containing protein [Tissierellia bacterium]